MSIKEVFSQKSSKPSLQPIPVREALSKAAEDRIGKIAGVLFQHTYDMGGLQESISSGREFTFSGLSWDETRAKVNLIYKDLLERMIELKQMQGSPQYLIKQAESLGLSCGKLLCLIEQRELAQKEQLLCNLGLKAAEERLIQDTRCELIRLQSQVRKCLKKTAALDGWDDRLKTWHSITESLYLCYFKFSLECPSREGSELNCSKAEIKTKLFSEIVQMKCNKEKNLESLKKQCQYSGSHLEAHSFLRSLPLSFCIQVFEEAGLFPPTLSESAEALASAWDMEVYDEFRNFLVGAHRTEKKAKKLEKLSLLFKQREFQRKGGELLKENLITWLDSWKKNQTILENLAEAACTLFGGSFEKLSPQFLVTEEQEKAEVIEEEQPPFEKLSPQFLVTEEQEKAEVIEEEQPPFEKLSPRLLVTKEQGKTEVVVEVAQEELPSLTPPVVTEIRVRYQLPEGHTCMIYGEGGGLSWTEGRALEKSDEGTYVCSLQNVSGSVQYKLKLDDKYWEKEKGNRGVEEGMSQTIAPSFFVPVVVRCDGVKEGDKVFIRGSGPGMSWTKGAALSRIDGAFVFDAYAPYGGFEFKVLLNDDENHWCTQQTNYWVAEGQTLDIGANFH
jgi:hypothetical protein